MRNTSDLQKLLCLWIEDKQEFAKFVSAVENYVFEEDGKGIAYTDNHFYAYYWNIDGEPIPYVDVNLNGVNSQDVVKIYNKQVIENGKQRNVRESIGQLNDITRNLRSKRNDGISNNKGSSDSRRNGILGSKLLRKGRYFNNPSLYVKTQRADRYNRDGINSTVSSSPAPVWNLSLTRTGN